MRNGSFNSLANSLPFYSSSSSDARMVSLSAPSEKGGQQSSSGGGSSMVPSFMTNIVGKPSYILSGTINPFATNGDGHAPTGRINGSLPLRDVDEEAGLMGFANKGFSFAKAGAAALAGGARSVVNTAQQSMNDAPVVLNTQRLVMFGVTAGVGSLFMLLAFVLLPTIVFAPSKFALLFTMGSVCFIMSLGFLKGFRPLVAHLISWRRLPFTVIYGVSLILTLYGTLVVKSYILALLFSLIQIGALVSVLVSYIPGGTAALKFVGGTTWKMVAGSCKRYGAREATLPI